MPDPRPGFGTMAVGPRDNPPPPPPSRRRKSNGAPPHIPHKPDFDPSVPAPRRGGADVPRTPRKTHAEEQHIRRSRSKLAERRGSERSKTPSGLHTSTSQQSDMSHGSSVKRSLSVSSASQKAKQRQSKKRVDGSDSTEVSGDQNRQDDNHSLSHGDTDEENHHQDESLPSPTGAPTPRNSVASPSKSTKRELASSPSSEPKTPVPGAAAEAVKTTQEKQDKFSGELRKFPRQMPGSSRKSCGRGAPPTRFFYVSKQNGQLIAQWSKNADLSAAKTSIIVGVYGSGASEHPLAFTFLTPDGQAPIEVIAPTDTSKTEWVNFCTAATKGGAIQRGPVPAKKQ